MDNAYGPLEQLQHKCLKRILKVPTSTPNPATTIEFGNLPIRSLVHRRQLSFYHKLKAHPETLAGQILMKQETSMAHLPHTWAHHIHQVLDEYNLTMDNDITKETWKNQVRKPTSQAGKAAILEEASHLSKLSTLTATKQTVQSEKYITELPQYKAALIFKARCRMLNFKNNFRNGKTDLSCELCKANTEDDGHIFNDCEELQSIRGDIRYEELFSSDTTRYNHGTLVGDC